MGSPPISRVEMLMTSSKRAREQKREREATRSVSKSPPVERMACHSRSESFSTLEPDDSFDESSDEPVGGNAEHGRDKARHRLLVMAALRCARDALNRAEEDKEDVDSENRVICVQLSR